MRSDAGLVKIATLLYGFNAVDTLIDGKNFQRLTIPGEEIDRDTMHAGLPQIPFVTLKIAVPDSCDFDVSVKSLGTTTLNGVLIYPVSRIEFVDTGGLICSREVYTYDTSFYEKDTLYPNKTYDIVNVSHWRDQRVMEIILYPVQFDPNDTIVYCASNMELKVEYVGQVSFDSSSLGPYEGLARDILLNYRGIDRQPPPHPSPSVHYYTNLLDASNVADYIIVTAEAFLLNETTQPKINQFAQWRVDHNSFDVAVVSMQDIMDQFEPQGHDSIQLKNFLKYAYNNWHAYSVADDHYAYCLFLGDWDYVPTIMSEYIEGEHNWLGANDYYYVELDPMSVSPDIMLGRWPVKVGKWQDLFTIADKTLNYEQNPTLGDWRRNVFLTAGDMGDGAVSNPKIYQCYPCVLDIGYDTIIVTKYTGSGSDDHYCDSLRKYLNAGNLLTTYIDHGDPKGWDSYDTTDLKILTNGARLPVVFSNACLTAMFQWDNPFYDQNHFRPHSDSSFGELMLVHPNGGAVAFWGATVYSYIPLYQIWCKNMFVYQNWILGYSADARSCGSHGCYCLLGDPALDLGDYTAYPTLPDLLVRPVAEDFKVLEPYPYPATNAVIPIRAKVMNIGHVAPASNIAVKFRVLLQGSTIYENTVWVNPIPPRDSVIATTYWNTALTNPNFVGVLGDCQIEVTVDPNNLITESWKLNNNRTLTKKVVLYPYLTGWPKKVSLFSQPALGNIDMLTSEIEIAYAGMDSVYVFRPNGAPGSGWPKPFKNVEGLTLADINNNGALEIIAYSPESLKVFDNNGNILPGWPVIIPLANYLHCTLPAVGHIDAGGSWSIVTIARPDDGQPMNLPIHILVYASDGQLSHDFTATYPVTSYSQLTGVSVEDVMISGNDEIIISYVGAGFLPVYCTEIFNSGSSGPISTLGYGNYETVGLYDVNANIYADLIVGDATGHIKAYDAQNNVLIWDQPADPGYQIRSSPVIGDIHPFQPGVEINFGNNYPRIHLRRGVNGGNIAYWPDTITGVSVTSSTIGHIDNDNNLDIMTATQGFYLYVHDYNKNRIAPYPLPFFDLLSSPVLSDINGDRRNETVVATADGYLHVLKNVNSRVVQNSVEWPQFHHDYQHTGVYGGP